MNAQFRLPRALLAGLAALAVGACNQEDAAFVSIPTAPPDGEAAPAFERGAVVLGLDNQVFAFDRAANELVNLGQRDFPGLEAAGSLSWPDPARHAQLFRGDQVGHLVQYQFPDGAFREIALQDARIETATLLALSERWLAVASLTGANAVRADVVDVTSGAPVGGVTLPADATAVGDAVLDDRTGFLLMQVQLPGRGALFTWPLNDLASPRDVTAGLPDGWSVLSGGFGMAGSSFVVFSAERCAGAVCEVALFRFDTADPAAVPVRISPADQAGGEAMTITPGQTLAQGGTRATWLQGGRVRSLEQVAGQPTVRDVTGPADGPAWLGFLHGPLSGQLAFFVDDGPRGALMLDDGAQVATLAEGIPVGSFHAPGRQQLAFSGNGRWLAAQMGIDRVDVFDTGSRQLRQTIVAGANIVEWRMDRRGDQLFVVTGSTLQVWNIANGNLVHEIALPPFSAVNAFSVLGP